MPVIQCPGCKKKLKLKTLREGASVKCPGCAEVFKATAAPSDDGSSAPKAAKKTASSKADSSKRPAAKKKAAAASGAARPTKKRPAKKKRPAPVDDFDNFDDFGSDDYGGDDFGDDYGSNDDFGQSNQRRSSGGGKKGAKKKKAAEKKSKKPLIIVLAVVLLAAIGGGVFFLLNNGEEKSDSVAENSKDTGAAGGENAGGKDAGGNKGAGGNVGGNNNGLASAVATSPKFKWLLDDTEVFIELDVQQLIKGPVGELLKLPMVTGPVAMYENQLGLKLTDLKSITVGLAGASNAAAEAAAQSEAFVKANREGRAIAPPKPPRPEDSPFVVVVRSKAPIDLEKVHKLIPFAESATKGDTSFLRTGNSEDGSAASLMNGDPNTLIFCFESSMPSVMNAKSLPRTKISTGMVDGNSTLNIVFVPDNPDLIFRSSPVIVSKDPAKKFLTEFLQKMQPITEGLSIQLELTNDVKVVLGAITKSSRSAGLAGDAIMQLMDDTRTFQKEGPEGQVPVPIQLMLKQGIQTLDSVKVGASGSTAQASYTEVGGGQKLKQQLADAGPMLPFLISQAMSQSPSSNGPSFSASRGPSGSTSGQQSAQRSMKEIALAMHYFHDAYNRFPNASAMSPDGAPLLSWRVHLLPYLGHEELYNKFNPKEPWDSPTNRPLADQMPGIYRANDPSVAPNQTVFLVPVGEGTAFEGGKGHALRDFRDGTSNTVLLVKAAPSRAVIWTQPIDYDVDQDFPSMGLARVKDRFEVGMIDGSVHLLPRLVDDSGLQALFSRSGGEKVEFSDNHFSVVSSSGSMGSGFPGSNNSPSTKVEVTEADITRLNLQKQSFLNGKIEMMIPPNFEPSSSEEYKKEFPMAFDPPTEFLKDKMSGVTLSISHTDVQVNSDQPLSLSTKMEMLQTAGVSTGAGFGRGKKKLDIGGTVWIQDRLTTQGLKPIHHLRIGSVLDGRLLVISFAFSDEAVPTMLESCRKALHSIKMIP